MGWELLQGLPRGHDGLRNEAKGKYSSQHPPNETPPSPTSPRALEQQGLRQTQTWPCQQVHTHVHRPQGSLTCPCIPM